MEKGGKREKRQVLTFSSGSSPVRADTLGTMSRNFFKNFALYIKVLRIRFCVRNNFNIWIFGYLDGLDELVNGSKTS